MEDSPVSRHVKAFLTLPVELELCGGVWSVSSPLIRTVSASEDLEYAVSQFVYGAYTTSKDIICREDLEMFAQEICSWAK